MGVCRATKANGEPCTLPANGPQGLCWAHDPANHDKRAVVLIARDEEEQVARTEES